MWGTGGSLPHLAGGATAPLAVGAGEGVEGPGAGLQGLQGPLADGQDGQDGGPDAGPGEGPLVPGGLGAAVPPPRVAGLGPAVAGRLPADHRVLTRGGTGGGEMD